MHKSHDRAESACCTQSWQVPLGFAFRVVVVEGRLEGRGGTTVKKISVSSKILLEAGGRYRDRTCDPYHVKVVLYR